MSLLGYSKAVQNGSDDFVRNQLYSFNFGKFDNLPYDVRYNVMNIICDEMDKRHLW